MGYEHYFVYCKGLLGVKINKDEFKWIYGSNAPEDTFEEYEKCLVKFDIVVQPEKKLLSNHCEHLRFQSYSWNKDTGTIYYRRTLPLKISIGYNIRLDGNTVYADIGSNYLKFVKNRTMNLHGIYYLLSDIANVLLLRLGYMTLYASCACHTDDGKSIVCFSPPGTGKTRLAFDLCERLGYSLVGEDVIISDGMKAYACPWTSSYKNRQSLLDSSFSLKKASDSENIGLCRECNLMDLVVLTLGQVAVIQSKEEIFRRIQMITGYLFQYYSSPIIKILGYFDDSFNVRWDSIAESFVRNLVDTYRCYEIKCEDRKDFSGIVNDLVSGKAL